MTSRTARWSGPNVRKRSDSQTVRSRRSGRYSPRLRGDREAVSSEISSRRRSPERRVRKDLHQNLEQFVFLLRPAPIDQNLVDDGLQKADEQPPGRRAAGDFDVSARKDPLERLGGEIFKLDPLVILCRIFPHDQSANALLDDFPETPFFFRGCFSLETALKEGVQRSGLPASTVTGG